MAKRNREPMMSSRSGGTPICACAVYQLERASSNEKTTYMRFCLHFIHRLSTINGILLALPTALPCLRKCGHFLNQQFRGAEKIILLFLRDPELVSYIGRSGGHFIVI